MLMCGTHGCAVVRLGEAGAGLLVVGGTGDTPAVGRSVELLPLEGVVGAWRELASLAAPRCCWPQVSSLYLGHIHNARFIIGRLKRNKYGYVQELRSTIGHLEFFKFLG